MANKHLLQLQKSVEEEIDEYLVNFHDPERFSTYLFERINQRISGTIFKKEEKLEMMAHAASYFFEKGIEKERAKLPTTFIDKIKFLFLRSEHGN